MTLRELREALARLITNARSKFDEIKEDTPEERAGEIEREFDAMMSDATVLEQKIARAELLEGLEGRGAEGDDRRPGGEDGQQRGGREDHAPNYSDVFEQALRFGVASMSAEERAVLMTGRESVPDEVRAQSVGTDSAGGFMVPEVRLPELDRALAAWGPMWDANIVRELNTSNGALLPWPTVDDTGKTGRIKAENASIDDDGTDDVVVAEKSLSAYVYDTGLVRIPLELLQDAAFNMEALLDDLFAERLGRTANTALTTGTGSSQPNGIVTASTLGKTAASATALTADEMMEFVHSVDPAYRASPKCRFMFNDSTLLALRKLKDGQGNYLWQMGDVRTGEPSQILGHQYAINQAMASIATGNKTVLFGDFGRYVVRKVIGFNVLTLRERYAEKFQIGMVGFKRFDGELMNTSAVKHLIQA